GIVLLLAGAVRSGMVVAQMLPGGHEQHHPAGPAGAPAPPLPAPTPPETPPLPSSPAPSGAAPPGMGTGTMMQGMGAPPKALYPSLMDLPDLPPEKRVDVQRAASERMASGTALMIEGLDQLFRAATTENYAGMQNAVATLHEGLARFDSGLAAQRALAEGRDARHM